MKTSKNARTSTVGVALLLLSLILLAWPAQALPATQEPSLEIIGHYAPPLGLADYLDLQVVGDLAYLGTNSLGLQIVSLANPAAPLLLSTLPQVGPVYALHVIGNLVYMASLDKGLQIANVSDPRNPYVVSGTHIAGWCVDLDVVGDLVYMASQNSGLYIYRVADPANPQFVSFDRCTPLAIAVRGDYAYISDGDVNNLLRVYDVSVPEAPWQINRTPALRPRELALAGNYAYIGTLETGVRVIDIADPGRAFETGYRELVGEAVGVTAADQRLYVSAGGSGLYILDTWTPQQPMLISNWPAPGRLVPPDAHFQKGYVLRARVEGDMVYALDKNNGLYILRATLPPVAAFQTYLQQGMNGYSGAADTYLFAWNATSTAGSEGSLAMTTGNVRQSLIQFDLGALPAGDIQRPGQLAGLCDASACRSAADQRLSGAQAMG